MNSVKEERPLTRHAKFLIKELLATLDCLEKAHFTEELLEEMRNLSQEMINVLSPSQIRRV